MCIIIHSSMAVPVVGTLLTVLLLSICITIHFIIRSRIGFTHIHILTTPQIFQVYLPTSLLIVHKYPLFLIVHSRKWNCITMSVCKYKRALIIS